MPKYYFHLANVVFIGPNPDWPTGYAGAYVNCIVQAPNQSSAVELLISDLKESGFFYESVEEIMDLARAVEKYDLDPDNEDLKSSDPVIYGEFHCYPHNSEKS